MKLAKTVRMGNDLGYDDPDYRKNITEHFYNAQPFQNFLSHLARGEFPTLSGLISIAPALFLGNVLKHFQAGADSQTGYQTLFYLTENDQAAHKTCEEIQFFFPNLEGVHHYPSLSELPGKLTPLPVEECHARHTLIHAFSRSGDEYPPPQLIITSLKAALEKIPSPRPQKSKPKTTIHKSINLGDTQPLIRWGETLEKMGYRRNHEVVVPGEYTIKSGILDVFIPRAPHPYRIYFWDEEVEMIKPFHPHTQQLLPSKGKKIHTLELASSRLSDYFLYDGEGFIKKIFSEGNQTHEMKKMKGLWQSSQEFSWALLEPFLDDDLWEWTSLPSLSLRPLIFLDEKNLASETSVYKDFSQPYRLHSGEGGRNLFANPEKRFYLPESLTGYSHITFHRYPVSDGESRHIHFATQKPMGFKKNIDKCREYLLQQSETKNIYLFTSNPVSGKKWVDFFHSLNPVLIEGDDETETLGRQNSESRLQIVCHALSGGLDFGKQLLITDFELFRKKPKISLKGQGLSEVLEYFTELKEGDYVVHINQGIGRYLGLERIGDPGNEKDYLKIVYQGGDKLFVPVEQMNLVQRYIGNKGQTPRIDTLGGKSWDRIKNRVKKQLEILTQELIALYQKRRDHKKIPCQQDDYFQELFESAFPYQETEDQLRATEEIKRDLEADMVMDRLLCGDVGFGKTEVAMRAVFKVVFSGRQAAILVPTTILSLQHYQRFEERFQDFPVTIRVLNRFKDRGERETILKETASGKVEILIGTHALLSEKVEFKKLGLLVVDEEQKFGVKQKENIKKNYPHVDTLALSATPIPRTLHLSLSSIRSLSVLNTPPQNRHAVKTYVLEWDMLIIKEAVKRERERGGQIFFVHNQVSTLASVAALLAQEMPELRIRIAHGQMPGRDLERVMDAFVHHRFDMLVSTSIIESGMDLSRVNTLMVNNTDHFGLTQLYQLRGRVGRSSVEAYAYFLLPPDRSIGENAMKRLDALTAHTELGAGFKIAMSDLEIRGPGNILGAEQSGNIMAIGFELYTRLLNESINQSLISQSIRGDEEIDEQGGETQKKEKPDIFLGSLLELKYEGFIPHHYIPEDRQKIAVYKKIAAIETLEGIDRVRKEIEAQYGKSIEIIERLLKIAEVRVYANEIRLFSVCEREGNYEITLFAGSRVNRELLLQWVVDKTLEIIPEHPEKFRMPTKDEHGNPLSFEVRLKKLRDLLLALKTKSE